jgi:hypothetical protein
MVSLCDGIRFSTMGNGRNITDEGLHLVAVELISWLIKLDSIDKATIPTN